MKTNDHTTKRNPNQNHQPTLDLALALKRLSEGIDNRISEMGNRSNNGAMPSRDSEAGAAVK